jgi:hypothetical protein
VSQSCTRAKAKVKEGGYSHCLLQTLFIDRKLDSDVGELRIYVRIGLRTDGRIVPRVLVILRNRPDA